MLCGKEPVVPPQPEAAVVFLAEEALFALADLAAAAGAFADDLPAGGEQHLRAGDDLIGFHQLGEHIRNAGHELVRGKLAALHLLQAVFPFGGEKRGL